MRSQVITITRFKKIAPTLVQFGLVGLSGTLVNLALLALLVTAGLPHLLAALIATEVSIINNFVWNDRWTFKRAGGQSSLLDRFKRFQVVSSLTAILTLGLFTLLADGLHWNYLLAQFVAIGIATVVNFSVNSTFTWGKESRQVQVTTEGPGSTLNFGGVNLEVVKELEEYQELSPSFPGHGR